MSALRAIRSFPVLALALVALVVAAGLTLAPAAQAGTADDERQFVQLINQTRSAAGLAPLSVHPELVAAARGWAGTMAGTDQLAHSPNIASGINAPWTVLGENVGVHDVANVGELHAAFVASPAHYANIVDDRYRYIGVGVVVTEAGKMWTTHRFMATVEPATTAPPTTAAPPTTQPRPPTTAPPATQPKHPTTAPPTPQPQAPAPPGAGDQTSTDSSPPPDPIPDPETDGVGDGPDQEPGAVGPGQPDVETVEQMLIDLIEAGI